ncbi:hypothetical protein SteCoe_3534 [Stentor coeruleus]|uniref:Uncharacterized protein n=1 Tax=Stentor coeruleus TaxID=5963 RepID=A0A1R2CWS9_9CILI|nr:hypothetical protein SteCoe_3534 [Stentor coeruleus]
MEENQRMSSLFKSIPAFALIVCSLHTIFFLLSLLFPFFILSLTCIPHYTIRNFEPWRIITSPFITYYFFELSIVLPSYWSTAVLTEKRMGSLRYFFFFFSNTVLIQIFYFLGSLLVEPLNISIGRIIIGEIMAEIMLISKKNPESPIPFLCCPGRVKSIYYPYLALFLFACLGFPFEGLAGVIVGLLNTKISFSNLQRNRVEDLEKNVCFACFGVVPNFIPVSQAGEEELPFTFIHAENAASPPQRNYERFNEFEDDSL